MEIPGAEERRRELEKIDEQHDYYIVGGVIVVLLFASSGFALFTDQNGYGTNLFTEFLSIVLTIMVLDRRAEKRANQQLKAQLIRELSSGDIGIVRRAINELRAPERRWLYDGSLRKADLEEANLQGVDLVGAVMPDAFLRFANLNNADLKCIDLHKANLIKASLESDLYNADLRNANLQGAYLRGAILSNIKLQGANLNGAELPVSSSAYSVRTVLPDGNSWTPDTDMRRFTDPNHPHYWRSDDPDSPAYRNPTGESRP